MKELLEKLREDTEKLKKEFNEPFLREKNIGMLLNTLKEVKQTSRANDKYRMRSCIMLYDILKHNKSNELTLPQMEVVTNVINIILMDNVKKEDFYKVDTVTSENGLDHVDIFLE